MPLPSGGALSPAVHPEAVSRSAAIRRLTLAGRLRQPQPTGLVGRVTGRIEVPTPIQWTARTGEFHDQQHRSTAPQPRGGRRHPGSPPRARPQAPTPRAPPDGRVARLESNRPLAALWRHLDHLSTIHSVPALAAGYTHHPPFSPPGHHPCPSAASSTTLPEPTPQLSGSRQTAGEPLLPPRSSLTSPQTSENESHTASRPAPGSPADATPLPTPRPGESPGRKMPRRKARTSPAPQSTPQPDSSAHRTRTPPHRSPHRPSDSPARHKETAGTIPWPDAPAEADPRGEGASTSRETGPDGGRSAR